MSKAAGCSDSGFGPGARVCAVRSVSRASSPSLEARRRLGHVH